MYIEIGHTLVFMTIGLMMMPFQMNFSFMFRMGRCRGYEETFITQVASGRHNALPFLKCYTTDETHP